VTAEPATSVIVVTGVSGSGKTTIAGELANRLGWTFEEGDNLHPEANVAKLHAGIPLEDADRAPWLNAVAGWIDLQRARNEPSVITCSALKRSYREIIIDDRPNVRLVYLRGSYELIASRLAQRHGHLISAQNPKKSSIQLSTDCRLSRNATAVDSFSRPPEFTCRFESQQWHKCEIHRGECCGHHNQRRNLAAEYMFVEI
jgi:carbohydrate kinase (thermoresistant glucokinase family)